jgi:hypothetical protein
MIGTQRYDLLGREAQRARQKEQLQERIRIPQARLAVPRDIVVKWQIRMLPVIAKYTDELNPTVLPLTTETNTPSPTLAHPHIPGEPDMSIKLGDTAVIL